jgi:HK97 family phage prohead protease
MSTVDIQIIVTIILQISIFTSMKGLLEYKDFTAEVKDVDIPGGTVTGWWCSYGNKDFDEDIIVEGAATKTIAERGPQGSNEIFFLNQHKWDQPHCRPDVLISDAKGIYFEAKPAPTTYSKDALILYDAGVVIQHSIGFVTIREDRTGTWGSDDFARYIKEIKLYEGSNVTLGANPNTPFTGFKSLTITQLNDQVSIFLKLLKTGTLTDDTFAQLEIGLKIMQKQAYELGQNDPLKLKVPAEATPAVIPPVIDPVKKSFNSLIIK